ncbi:MAG TPA: hypothetical protein VF185_04720 [Patescibacteria group bacterium]
MMVSERRYKSVRFYLFANSYPGRIIRSYFNDNFAERKTKEEMNWFCCMMYFEYNQFEKFIVSNITPKCPFRRIPMLLKIYLEIENELINITEDRLDKYSTVFEDYQWKLLSPAIERAAGNFLENLNDVEFEKAINLKIKKYQYIYYKIVRKYRLPTMRNIPFILRLV